jgi:hypothetical protein
MGENTSCLALSLVGALAIAATVTGSIAFTRVQDLNDDILTLNELLKTVPRGPSSPEMLLGTWVTSTDSPEWNTPWMINVATDVHKAAVNQEHLGGLNSEGKAFSATGPYSMNRITVVIQSIDTQVPTPQFPGCSRGVGVSPRPGCTSSDATRQPRPTGGRVFTGMFCGHNVRPDGSVSREYVMPFQGVLNDDMSSGPVSILFQSAFYTYPGHRNTTTFDGWWENLGDGKARLARSVQSYGEPYFFQEGEGWFHYTYRSSSTLYKDSTSVASCARMPISPTDDNFCRQKADPAIGELNDVLPDQTCSK